MSSVSLVILKMEGNKKMNNTKETVKTIKEQETNEKALLALANELANIKQASKQIQEKTSIFILKALEHCKKYGDTSIFKKVFFLKIGKVYLYNSLNLKNYFLENEVFFLYNVKKDSLKIFGNWKEIKESYKEYLERKRKEKQKERLSEKPEEKIERLFKSKIESLDKSELALLKVYINK